MLSQENCYRSTHTLREEGKWFALGEYDSYSVLSRADNRKLSPTNSPKKTSERILTVLRRSGHLSVEDLERKLGIPSDAAEEEVLDCTILELWNQRKVACRWD